MKKCNPLLNLYGLIAMLMIFVTHLSAQSKAQLESRREELLREIELTSQKIEKARSDKSDAAQRIQTLETQIEKRNELVNNLCESIDLLNNQAIQTNSQATILQKELDQLKYDYRQVMQTAYRRHLNYHYYLMLFSARSVNDFFNWVLYIKQFDTFVTEKVKSITGNQQALMDNIYKIESSKEQKLKLVSEQERQQNKMTSEINEKNSLVQQLSEQESTLIRKIRDKENEKEQINRKIEKIIAAEIKAAKEAELKKTKSSPKSDSKRSGKTSEKTANTSPKSTPKADPLSVNFEGNKGKLPWPLKKALVIAGFGKKEHPTVKGIYTINKGIYIKTDQAAEVTSVFDGKVVAILSSPAYKECVLVKHGDYFTLYANLNEVNVKKNSSVSAGQVLGRVAFEDTYNSPVLYFEIWKGESPMNPELWLKSL